LHRGLSHEELSLSTPSIERLRAWRLYFESAMALVDVLDAELQRDAGIPMRWYDALVHLEETPDGLRMNELAERILYSKSGFTRVVDRMEDAGLVRRVRPEHDRRSILVVLTGEGREKMEEARRHHRHSIEQHFSAHLADTDVKALARGAPSSGPSR
jgi:DNA-binding MarR family transcriptional regulator